jgi:hypothetical protein
MSRLAIILEALASITLVGLFIWGFLTGPDAWGWQAFAWLAGIK